MRSGVYGVLAVAALSAGGACATPAAASEESAYAAESGLYRSDPGHAYITFTYDHQGYSHPYLRWRTWSSELNWDSAHPERSTVSVAIDAASIDSGIDRFDEHLRGEDFFDTAAYPEIGFKSSSLEQTGPNTARLTGDLTIRDITRAVVLEVTLNKASSDPDAGRSKLGFSARGMVKRSDFGVDRYVPLVGDDVTLLIEAEFVKPEKPAD